MDPETTWLDLWFFPRQAADGAVAIDQLYTAMLWMTGFLIVGIAGTILVFMIRYRPGSEASREDLVTESWTLESLWVVIPALVVVAIFIWSMIVFITVQSIPESGRDIYVVGKQWMWKVQYPNGQREINSLHVPAGEKVRLRMTSQDVIHSFYIPAFRQKQDVLPGQYQTLAFEATETGTYHLFCAEYCGTDHSRMRGTVTVMEPSEYERWLEGGAAAEQMTLAESGAQLFEQQGCPSCHDPDTGIDAPTLSGLYGSEVRLASGETVTADEDYLRTSILQPKADIVAGYEPLMPSFQGQLSEDEVIDLIEYIKSLAEEERSENGGRD